MTTTSYAILGLLDLRAWTAYELTQQARRSLAYAWPISESQLYAEPKRLEREGLITISQRSAGPERTRQLFKITPKGRKALRAWLATEPVAPRIQMEILVRALFATSGSKQDLLDALAASRRSVRESYETARAITVAYQAGHNPFPNRLHANVIWMVFARDLLVLTMNWIDFAIEEVEGWQDANAGGDPDHLRELIDAMLAPPTRTIL